MINRIFFFLILISALNCNSGVSVEWQFDKSIPLGNISPISLAVTDDFIWVSDLDRDKVIKISHSGEVIETISYFSKPMHLCLFQDVLFVPESEVSLITMVRQGQKQTMPTVSPLNKPSAISFSDEGYAIADTDNNRIYYYLNEEQKHFGTRGNGNGQFETPTDVQLNRNEIYVADALNQRVQVFSKSGGFKRTIGSAEVIGRASGLFVTDELVLVADFLHNNVLTFDKAGNLLSVRNEYLRGPSDVAVWKEFMIVANYGGNSLEVFKKR